MRIVSLLPAATEWIAAFGAENDLVGRSHECDTPASVQEVPVVTKPTYESDGDSAAIDEAVQNQLQQGLSLYDVDLERLRALEPDLILTQAQCEVCAVSLPQLEDALADWSGYEPDILSMEPMTLKEVLDVALRIGRTIGRPEMAMQVIAAKERALQQLRNRMGLHRRTDPETLSTVACVEWMEPLMTAGHWMPDLAEMAGGRAVLAEKGTPSQVVEWDEVRAADPDVLAILPCGFTLEETRRDLHYLTERDGWNDLQAVRNGRVVLLDGNAYFNRPGPRLYRSIELLAEAIHPDAVDAEALAIEPWERQRWVNPQAVS
jgi:iron complex transport system substrate-binding protein